MSARVSKGNVNNKAQLTSQKSGTKSTVPASPKANASPHPDGAIVNGSSPLSSVNVRSKYTERKAILAPNRTRSMRLDLHSTIASANKQYRNEASDKQTKCERKVVVQSTAPKPRQWNRRDIKVKISSGRIPDKAETPHCGDMSIQTNESEILSYDHLIGDIKFMLPTKSLVSQIDKSRQEAKKRALLKSQRKFEDHAEGEEEHLTDLKEFLEKAVVTKRTRKPKDSMDTDKKLMNSMDEILNREIRRTESITDIKGRIKKKETELLSLFEKVENIKIHGNKN